MKANVMFFDRKPPREEPRTDKLCVYDLRTNKHFTQKAATLKRAELDEFVACDSPANRHARKPTRGAESATDGRWRCSEIAKRDKTNLDIFWLKDQSPEDSEDLREPDELAREIADDLQTALEQFSAIAGKLKE